MSPIVLFLRYRHAELQVARILHEHGYIFKAVRAMEASLQGASNLGNAADAACA